MTARPLRERPSGVVYDRDGGAWLVFGPFLEDEDGERFTRGYVDARVGPLTEATADIGAAG